MRSLDEWHKYVELQTKRLSAAQPGEVAPEAVLLPADGPAQSPSPRAADGHFARDICPDGLLVSDGHAEGAKSVVKSRPSTHGVGSPLPGKETREQLLARLLDPELTLEEAAQVLNVCATTVRRYTNRGVLPHYRTIGNQRRFRLSQVLGFLESQELPLRGAGQVQPLRPAVLSRAGERRPGEEPKSLL